MPTLYLLFNFLGGELMLVLLFSLIIVISLYPIYKLYKHLRATNANTWVWIGFIILVLRGCSSSSSLSSTNQQKTQVNRTYSNVWVGKIKDDNFSCTITYDSTKVLGVQYMTLGTQFLYKLENNPFLVENLADDKPETSEIDFSINETQTKNYATPISLKYSNDIRIEGKCNYENGDCKVTINGKVFAVKSNQVESSGLYMNAQ